MNEDEPLSEEFRSLKINQRRSMNLDLQFEVEAETLRQNNHQSSPFKSVLSSTKENFKSAFDRNSHHVSFGNANGTAQNNSSRISNNTMKTDMTHFYTANNNSNVQSRRTPANAQTIQFESNKLAELSRDLSLPNKSEDKSSVFLSNMNFDDERNFNKQEIEDFFGVDFKEMQKLVGASHRQNQTSQKPPLLQRNHNSNSDKNLRIMGELQEQQRDSQSQMSNTLSSQQIFKSALGGNTDRQSTNVRFGLQQMNKSGSDHRLEVIQEINGFMQESQTSSDVKADTLDEVDAEIEINGYSKPREEAGATQRIMDQQDSLFKLGGRIDDQHMDDRDLDGLDDSIRLEELKLEQKNLEDTHGFILQNQFQRFGNIMNKFALRNSKGSQLTNESSTVTPLSDNVMKQRDSKIDNGLKYESIQRPTASTQNSRATTGVKSPFSVQKQQSVSSIHSIPMSAGGSSVRCSAISEINSHKSAKIKLRISDIIFKEAQASDIEYILGSKTQYSSPKFRDLLTNEVMDVANINEWVETLQRQNQEDQVVDGVQLRSIVGSCCFYRQNNRLHQEREELKRVEEMIEQLQGKSSSRKETQQPLTKQQQIAKKYEETTLIGMILMQFQKPTDKDFPETLKLLPIFWPFRQKQTNQEHINDYHQNIKDQQQPTTPVDLQSNINQMSSNSHNNNVLNRDDLENHQLIQDRSLQEKAAKNQVAKILMLGVVPQCKRSGIGTLIYKKALHIIEQQFPHCVLIYYQRNPSFVSSNWRSIHSFLLKNHFKILNDSKLMGDNITEKTLFYYNITSLKLEKQRSINGLFAEFIKVVCRNPLALCNREGQKKIRKELKRAKMKYENEDLEDELEEFKTEQDVVAATQEQNQSRMGGGLKIGQSRLGLPRQQVEDQFEIPQSNINDGAQMTFQQIARARQHNLDNYV